MMHMKVLAALSNPKRLQTKMAHPLPQEFGREYTTPPKKTRRPHLKTRTGCFSCKRRRIKCNEQRPICLSCFRNSDTCEYPQPEEITYTPERASSATGDQSRSVGPVAAVSRGTTEICTGTDAVIDTTPVPTPRTGISTTIDPTMRMSAGDLELMHHYTRFTAQDLEQNGSGPSYSPVWQDFIPSLAFQDEFLLHGLLSIAGLHLGWLSPHRKMELTFRASVHQQQALAAFQAALPSVSKENCPSFFAFSCLLVPITFVSGTRNAESEDGANDIIQCIKLIQGGYGLLLQYKDELLQTPLKQLLQPMLFSNVRGAHGIPNADHILPLFDLCKGIADVDASNACTLATHDLLNIFGQVALQRSRGESSVLASLLWPANLGSKFIELLHARTPEVMVILGHYSVLLHRDSDTQTWYLVGYARYMLDAIQATLSDSWREMLSWPESCIR